MYYNIHALVIHITNGKMRERERERKKIEETA